nr:hypothetical protein 1 [Totiviridae sp.]
MDVNHTSPGAQATAEGHQEMPSSSSRPRRITAADLAPTIVKMPELPCYKEDARTELITLHDCPEHTKEYEIVLHERFYKTEACHSTCQHANLGQLFKHTYTLITGEQFSVTEHKLTNYQISAQPPGVGHLLNTEEERRAFNASLDKEGFFNHDLYLAYCTNCQLEDMQRIVLHRQLCQAIDVHLAALRQRRIPDQQTTTYCCSYRFEPTRRQVLQRTPPTTAAPEDPATVVSVNTQVDVVATTKNAARSRRGGKIAKAVKKMKVALTPAYQIPPPRPKNVQPLEDQPTQPSHISETESILDRDPSPTEPSILESKDKQTDLNGSLIFGGDIEQCWQGIYNTASRDPAQLSSYDLEIRSLQWGWVHCVSDAPTSLINRRIDSSTEANCRTIVEQGKGLKDQVGYRETNVPLPPAGKGMVVNNSTVKIKRREDGLSARARKIADDLRSNPARIRGFLAHGHVNRKWTVAVCRYLRSGKGIAPETAETTAAVDLPHTKKKMATTLNTATKHLIDAWATKDVGPLLEKKDSKEDTETLTDNVLDEVNEEHHARAVYTSARTAGVISAVHNAKVCIHCLMATTASPLPTTEGRFAQFSLEELRSLNLQRLIKSDSQGYLEACAAIHNREQHSQNGNIHFTAPAGPTRFDVAFLAKEKAASLKLILDTERPTDAALLNVCENNLSRANFYTDGAKHSVIPSSQGTLHQFAYDPTLWQTMLEDARNAKITNTGLASGGGSRPDWQGAIILKARREFTSSEDYSAITEDLLLDAANSLTDQAIPDHLHPKYVSVHTLPNHKADQIGLTMAATERIANSSAFASGGIGINDQRGYNIMNYVSGANMLLGSALQMATTDNLDWREIGLKAAILEACREPSATWPTGQEWAVPKRANPSTRYTPSIATGIQAIVVSLNYIDACLRENNGLKVRVNGTLDHWNMNDANLRVVSLGEDTSTVELSRSLRTVLALPFPVVRVIDQYQMAHLGDAPDTYTTKNFYRNASLVSMGDKVDRLVFIVPDKAQTSVKLGGVSRPVACPTRFNAAESVPDAWLADETLLKMLHMVMGCGRNLKALCNEYLSKYAEAPLNWNEIQALCGALITRFPRQPHIHVSYRNDTNVIEHEYSYGLPKQMLPMYDAINCTPQDDEDASVYGHGEAITCFSQLLITKLENCQDTCHLSLGRWSNYAEIVFAACVATFTPGTALGMDNTRIGIKTTGFDALNRMSLIRRSVEEWANATGMSEYILNPRLYPRSTGNIEAYITGGGNDPKIVTLRTWAATCIGGASVSWYWTANYEKSAPLAANHRRLGSALYQTDYTLSFRTLDLPPRNYIANNTIGSRGYGWAHLRGMEPTDDYEIEKFFSRLDYRRLNEWGYLYWPDGNIKREGAYMLSSTTTADLATHAGWRGFNDSYRGTWGWGVDYMKTDLKTETMATLALRPSTLSRVSASVFVSGLWQSIGIGLDTTVETTSSIIDRMRGFMLAAQPKDGTFLTQLEQIQQLHLPTRSDGTQSNASMTQLSAVASRTEQQNQESHHGAVPSPLPSSNPMATPNIGTSQNSGPQTLSDQTMINRAVPPTHKIGTDGTGGVALDQTERTDVN